MVWSLRFKLIVIHSLIGLKRFRDGELCRDDPMVGRLLGSRTVPGVPSVSRALSAAGDEEVAGFQKLGTVTALEALGVEYSLSVPFERFAELKEFIGARKAWRTVNRADGTKGFQKRWKPKSWERKARFVFLRSRNPRKQKDPLQLDFFQPREFGFDWAESQQLTAPFSVMGESLGAMATQRLIVEDPRVANAFCIHPPGWPWDAVGKVVSWNFEGICEKLPYAVKRVLFLFKTRLVVVGRIIDKEYGFDVLKDGDPRSHSATPPGNTRILYVIGEDDVYEPDKARQVWSNFYPGETAEAGVWPGDAPHQKKYFITVPGFRHDPPGPTVFEWGDFLPLVDSFFQGES